MVIGGVRIVCTKTLALPRGDLSELGTEEEYSLAKRLRFTKNISESIELGCCTKAISQFTSQPPLSPS